MQTRDAHARTPRRTHTQPQTTTDTTTQPPTPHPLHSNRSDRTVGKLRRRRKETKQFIVGRNVVHKLVAADAGSLVGPFGLDVHGPHNQGPGEFRETNRFGQTVWQKAKAGNRTLPPRGKNRRRGLMSSGKKTGKDRRPSEGLAPPYPSFRDRGGSRVEIRVVEAKVWWEREPAKTTRAASKRRAH